MHISYIYIHISCVYIYVYVDIHVCVQIQHVNWEGRERGERDWEKKKFMILRGDCA